MPKIQEDNVMTKYRVVMDKISKDAIYLIQKKSLFFNKWKTINEWANEESALRHFYRLTCQDSPNQKIIIESK